MDLLFRVWNTKEKKYHSPFPGCSTTYNLDYYEITPHVCYPEQFIGLFDSKRERIFVGDKLKGRHGSIYIVQGLVSANMYISDNIQWFSTVEIVGHIHEDD